MKHQKLLAVVVTFLCYACIGEVSLIRAEETRGSKISRFLPKTPEGMVKLTVAELASAVLNAKTRLGSSTADDDIKCELPPIIPEMEAEKKEFDELLTQWRTAADDRSKLFSEHAQLIGQKNWADAAVQMALQSQASLQSDLNQQIEEEANAIRTKTGSVKEGILKDRIAATAEAIRKGPKDLSERLSIAARVNAQLRAAEQAINRIQHRLQLLANKLASLDKKDHMSFYQLSLFYGTALGEGAQESTFKEVATEPHAGFVFEKMYDIRTDINLTTIKLELRSQTSHGNLRKVHGLLAAGADICEPPGQYTALALANIFGENRIQGALKRHRAIQQVPWDPITDASPQQILNMLDDQFGRVQNFVTAVKSSSTRRAELEYCDKLVQYWHCRASKLRSGQLSAWR